jgi:hypothetical protein
MNMNIPHQRLVREAKVDVEADDDLVYRWFRRFAVQTGVINAIKFQFREFVDDELMRDVRLEDMEEIPLGWTQ